MGYTSPQNYHTYRRLPFSFPVYDLDTLRALSRYQPGANIHLKVDTGMNRLGLQLKNIPSFIKELNNIDNLHLEGIYSHLSQTDDQTRSDFTAKQVKRVGQGSHISYGGTFTTKNMITIGIIPMGYYDGIDRRLSNKGIVILKGKECPIIGRVSMNLTIIDISKATNTRVGDEVTIINSNPHALNSLQQLSKLAQTIPYDLLVNLADSTRRTLV